MSGARRVVFALGGVALVAGAGYGSYWWTFERVAGVLRQDLSRFEGRIAELDDEMVDDRRVARELGSWASASLGASRDVVEHRFRAGLHALALEAGLSEAGLVVNCGTPDVARNPAMVERVAEFKDFGTLREQPDWYEVKGEVRGRGSYAASLRVVAMAQAQPWIARVSEVSVRPVDDARELFDVRVAARTVFAPDLMGEDPEGPPPVTPLSAGAEAMVSACVAGNLFVAPPPPAPSLTVVIPAPVVSVPEPAVAPPAPPPPYHEWRVVGVSESSSGDLAWLVGADGGRRFVAVGESVFELMLVGIDGESSVWSEGGAEVVVRIGQRLDQRSPR